MTDDVRRYWDTNASDFDSLYASGSRFHRLFNAVFRKALFTRVKMAADEVRRLPQAVVLDVGCGSGRTAIPLARAGAKRVVGIDFAPQMIDLANEAARAAGVSDVCEFRVGDFREMSAETPFDVVSAMGVFDYVDQPVPFLEKMLELAKRTVVFSVPKPSLVRANLRKLRYGRHGVPVHFYTKAALHELCRSAGAKNAEVHAIPAGYFVVCRRD